MGIETNPQSVEDLNGLWPADNEPAKEGGEHLRNIKKAVKVRANTSGRVGVTTLSSALDSDAENVAATSKAIKDLKTDLGAASGELTDLVSQLEDSITAQLQGLSFTSLKSVTGWQAFPGGMIIQWGRTNFSGGQNKETRTAVFPRSFPTACLNVQVTMDTVGQTYENIVGVIINTLSTSSVNLVYARAGDDKGGIPGMQSMWLAIGY